jgi:phage replication O-like protein O
MIPNDVLDALVKYRVPGEEMKCLLFIIRKTLGWNKKSDHISISQFHQATEINKSNIIRALRRLELKNLIIVGQKDNKIGKSYRFNKKYKTWETLAKRTSCRAVKNDNKPLAKRTTNNVTLTNGSLVKLPPTKERNKKKKERENPPSEFTKISRSGFPHQPLTDEEKMRRIEELKRQAKLISKEENKRLASD